MLPVIELSRISKFFYQRNWPTLLFRRPLPVQALDDVNLTVNQGEIMGLLGPNGAGKTTLIKILATLITPDQGGGTISGFDLCSQSHRVREKIGLVSANDRTFYRRLTGLDNLNFFAGLYNLRGPKRGSPINTFMAMGSGLLGGMLYPVSVLPAWLKPVSAVLPITHGLEAMRQVLLNGGGIMEIRKQLLILTLLSIVLMALGSYSLHVSLKVARKEGSLLHYLRLISSQQGDCAWH